MKSILALVTLLAAVSVQAGAPGLEMPDALIENVEKTRAGWVVTVSGRIEIFLDHGPGNDADQETTILYANKARVSVPVGNQLYALSMLGSERYVARMKAAVGKHEYIQMWGPTLTIEAGQVVAIVAGDVSFLRPRADEAAFDISRLPEIGSR